jgi:hypothetical protein
MTIIDWARVGLVAMEVYGEDVDFGMAQVVRIY